MKPFTLAIATLALSAAPLAAQTIFTGQTLSPMTTVSGAALDARNSFFGSLQADVATESFETQNLGEIPGGGLNLNFGFAGDATLTATGGQITTSTANVFATTGSQLLRYNAGSPREFNVTFQQRVAGFGFYGTDIGDFAGVISLAFYNDDMLVNDFVLQTGMPGDLLDGNLLFWGVLFNSNAFNRVSLVSTGGSDVFGIDDLTVADVSDVIAVVPEPGSLALMFAGLIGLGMVTRIRRVQAGSRVQ